MVGNFCGSNISWFGELGRFRGFISSWHTYSNHLVIYVATEHPVIFLDEQSTQNSQKFEIHKNLNHTNFEPHKN